MPSALRVNTPCAGPPTNAKLNASPSTSVALKDPECVAPSPTVTESGATIGASFTGVSVTLIVRITESARPSLACTVKLSVATKPTVG